MITAASLISRPQTQSPVDVFITFVMFTAVSLSLTNLDALLRQISAIFRRHIYHHQPVAQRFYGTLYTNDATRAFCRHIQIVSDGSGRDLQDVVWGTLIQENSAQSW
jgi:hypothetical protein